MSRSPQRPRAARWLGATLLLAGLLLYHSHEARPVLGLWSWPYAALLGAVAAWGVASARDGWLRREVGLATRLLDAGILLWGAAYFWAAWDDPAQAGRLADGNALGAVAPGAALLEWLAMVPLTSGILLGLAARLGARSQAPLLAIGAVLAVLWMGEGAIRLRGALAPTVQGFPTNVNQQWMRRHVAWNALGFRDSDHPTRAGPGVRRLLTVGDSFAFGWGVERIGDRFGERLAGLLAEATGEPWESLNASRGNSHTLHEMAYLEALLPYEPDVVVLLYVLNDADYLAAPERPSLAEAPGALGRLRPDRLLFANSFLYQELYVRVRMARFAASEGPGGIEAVYADPELLARHLDDVERLVALGRAAGAAVFVVPFEIAGALDPRRQEAYARFVTHASERGLPVLSLERTFEGEPWEAVSVNALDGHPNARAHAMAARDVVGPILGALAKKASP